MRETKPFASLSSGLLARKGAAKPAMRPQGFGGFASHNLDDLGWNDMGHHEPAAEPDHHPAAARAEIAPLSGAAGLTPAAVRNAPEPAVVAHQRALEHQFAAEPAAAPEPAAETVVALPRRRGDPARGKAAFTLRLDTDRHLKLRLACALTRVSAQQLVTGALDDLLKSLPAIDRLADRLPAASGR